MKIRPGGFMRFLLQLFSFTVLFAMSQFVFAKDISEDQVYTQDKLGITVIGTKPQFVIKLKSNPTTGYSWYLRSYDTNLITPVKHEYEPPADKNLVGAGGYEIWTFHVKSTAFIVPQQTMVRFVYDRPWESVDQATQVVFKVSTQAK
jgi:inhibitor of cysteine peptidase